MRAWFGLVRSAAVAAFTLEPYRVWKHPWRISALAAGDPEVVSSVADSRFNASARVAWVPRGADDVSEAVAFRSRFYEDRGTLEFVHVHKCGGMTFSHVAPGVVCPSAFDEGPCGGCVSPWGYKKHPKTMAAWDGEACGAPCCVMRQRPSLPALLDAWPFPGTPPRFVSAFEEFDAFALPWVAGETYKAVMVRDRRAGLVFAKLQKCDSHRGRFGRLWTRGCLLVEISRCGWDSRVFDFRDVERALLGAPAGPRPVRPLAQRRPVRVPRGARVLSDGVF